MSNDDEEFEDFYRTMQPQLLDYCTRLLGDHSAAWDTAQEAPVRTWITGDKVSQRDRYCYKIAINLVRDLWIKQARQCKIHDLLGVLYDTQETHCMPAEERHAVRELVHHMQKRLPVPTLLHYWADFSSPEIAQMMNKPQSTIRRQLLEPRALLAA